MKYREYEHLSLTETAAEILGLWDQENAFQQSITYREGGPAFVFYEGPPSANGKPGIHHVMSRTIKDLFCRYKTLKGYQVKRKAGWDTHGLPVELGVEKELGITKEDIGTKISIEAYNQACRQAVMRYTDVWNDLTRKMGYWVDMAQPYITYENKYIESVWWLLSKLYQKDLMYKGYTIQPYSPAAGTGLSSHEINQPGCYREVKDTSIVAMFKSENQFITKFSERFEIDQRPEKLFFLAWTTTPWTLPSNTALAVGIDIDYVAVVTKARYSEEEVCVLLAEALLEKHFPVRKDESYRVVARFKGREIVGTAYEQLLPFAKPAYDADKAFHVIAGDFVSTEDGTGIVHIAPTFGADDAKAAREAGVPPMLVDDGNGNLVPLVDLQGRFTSHVGEWAGMFVKNEYYSEGQAPEKSVDVLIAIQLKERGLAFNVEKYAHSYPHCWRTDKPVLYYPLDSWFIKATAFKQRMADLNETINWKPPSTGTGRFGNWLENLNDWNLSRSRFWGIPIPVWSTEDGSYRRCISSVEELKNACEQARAAGFIRENPFDAFEPGNMDEENYHSFDLHKNVVDAIVLVSPEGKPMRREADLIDVWFDSGAMPYAQWHYPFENKELIDGGKAFPADFIAEGVDQTRGWFYTLHAIATMCFDSVAYKNVVSNGLVLDKNGQKMSKRLGNTVDPFDTLATLGPDATRWYMISNAQPWDNLRFDLEGVKEVQRRFFGTLYNTYSFFALYANVDGFISGEPEIPFSERPEIDRWILSKLNNLVAQTDEAYAAYEPTKASRLIQHFVTDQLSNWYVRLCRKRFWRGDYGKDKLAAYQTLYQCLETVAIIASPISPFYMDRLFRDLTSVTKRYKVSSVHLADYPKPQLASTDYELEKRMDLAQQLASMILSIRKKEKVRVRQPLAAIMVPVPDEAFGQRLKAVEDLILHEVNVKRIDYLGMDDSRLVKQIKPNFKTLGPRFGKQMKEVAALISSLTRDAIAEIEQRGTLSLSLAESLIEIELQDVEIVSQDIPGWKVMSEGALTVALDISPSHELVMEGLAREFVNRVQNLRKDSGLEVTDRILLTVEAGEELRNALSNNLNYICTETLTDRLELADVTSQAEEVELVEGISAKIALSRANSN
jgi:isoleucyl-tRNA synthetase